MKDFRIFLCNTISMCGIAGIISLNGSKITNGKARVNMMLNKMKHRGPDGSGIFENGNRTVFLANNRLAITDPFIK